VRFWMQAMPAVIRPASPAQAVKYDSGNSVLLHYFCRGDDDASLHDHPWDFSTTILAGGYVEHRPPTAWNNAAGVGPEWDQRHLTWHAGDTIRHLAEDLHCVGKVNQGTWTLVRTGPKRREWGF